MHAYTQEVGKKRENKGKKRRNKLAHIQRYENMLKKLCQNENSDR
jgi:hypothetical protein